jgi:hypothetical protein
MMFLVSEVRPFDDGNQPYRSIVAWYCWRAVQIYGGAARTAVTA